MNVLSSRFDTMIQLQGFFSVAILVELLELRSYSLLCTLKIIINYCHSTCLHMFGIQGGQNNILISAQA